MTRRVSCCAFAACLLASTAARAQLAVPAPAATSESVEARLRRGFELRRAGRDDEAVTEFVEAYRLAPGPRTAAQLGLARQAVGAWLEADRLLSEALASPEDAWVSRNRAALESARAVAAAHVGTLDVRANVPGAEVRIEGVAVGTLPLRAPLRVLSGVVSMEVAAPGHVTVSRRFVVQPGAVLRESVELRPDAPAVSVRAEPAPAVEPTPGPAPRPAPTTEAPFAPRWRLWALAPTLTGGASLVLAGVAIGVRESAALQYNSTHCPPPPPTDARCGGLANAAAAWEVIAWTAGLAGAALAVAGVTMFLVPARRAPRASALSCLPSGAGLACGLRF